MEYIDLTGVCVAVLTAIFGILVYKVYPYLKALFEQHFDANERETVMKWVKIAVDAAEMIFRESGMGAQKKAEVLKFLHEKLDASKEYLEKHGFTIDWNELDKMIEAEVEELNKPKK